MTHHPTRDAGRLGDRNRGAHTPGSFAMPTFATPGTATVDVNIAFGSIQLTASDRGDTVVTVHPTNASRPADVAYAEDTRVELVGDVVTVVGPRGKPIIIGPSGSIDVDIALPEGSRVTAKSPGPSIRARGPLGAVTARSSAGSISLEHVTAVEARTSVGDIIVDSVEGDAELTVDTGSIRLGGAGGDVRIKNTTGSIRIGEVGGRLAVRSAHGPVEIDRPGDSVSVANAHGSIRIGEVARGAVRVDGGYGEVEVGIREGVAVWLDAATRSGSVRNELLDAEPPTSGAPSVEVRARTSYGDIVLRRVR